MWGPTSTRSRWAWPGMVPTGWCLPSPLLTGIRTRSSFTASLSLSPALASSPLLQPNRRMATSTLPLSVRAVDPAGNFGSATIQPLIMDPQGVDGTLVVSLDWDAPVDLDLHVQVPADNDAGLRDCLGQSAQCGAKPPGWRRGRQPGFRLQRGLPDRWARQ